MNILIIENEIYLSHSIAKSLMEIGHTCSMCVHPDDVIFEKSYDVILVSTFIDEKSFNAIRKKYPEAIVILLASSTENNTSYMLKKYGASDYILKPFMVEQLVDKIEHYISYKILEIQCRSYENYFQHQFESISDCFRYDEELDFPVFVHSNDTTVIDAFAFDYAKNYNYTFSCIDLSEAKSLDDLKKFANDRLIYAINFDLLSSSDKQYFYDLIAEKKVIVANPRSENVELFSSIELQDKENIFTYDSILQIEEYVKYIIKNFQNKFNDTELSKKLGISRKSVWEKRKKYEIAR